MRTESVGEEYDIESEALGMLYSSLAYNLANFEIHLELDRWPNVRNIGAELANRDIAKGARGSYGSPKPSYKPCIIYFPVWP